MATPLPASPFVTMTSAFDLDPDRFLADIESTEPLPDLTAEEMIPIVEVICQYL